jgi:hypothetical protein
VRELTEGGSERGTQRGSSFITSTAAGAEGRVIRRLPEDDARIRRFHKSRLAHLFRDIIGSGIILLACPLAAKSRPKNGGDSPLTGSAPIIKAEGVA